MRRRRELTASRRDRAQISPSSGAGAASLFSSGAGVGGTVEGATDGSAFEKIGAFRVGVLGGLGACAGAR